MCGFTNSNYPQLQELHQKYADKGLSVLAFPSNQFGSQVKLIFKINYLLLVENISLIIRNQCLNQRLKNL